MESSKKLLINALLKYYFFIIKGLTKSPYLTILIFVINKGRAMETRIKICAGPGCKAWSSETMASRLKKLKGPSQVCLVPCMNKCGGGASIRLKDRGRIIKLREPKEVVDLIEGKIVALAQAG